MIVVTFALPVESSAFIRSLKNIKRDGTSVRGTLERRTSDIAHPTTDIRVLHTGVGAKACENRLRDFLREMHPEMLITSGFCGGTKDELHPGDLIIAENASNPELLKKARAILPGAIVGNIHSADQIIDPSADRYAIGREHGAIVVDMETETIARICTEKSIRALALQVVSDSPAAPFPAPPDVLFDVEKQRSDFFLLLAYIARKPLSAIRLAEFSKQIAVAKAKLADALCAVLRSF